MGTVTAPWKQLLLNALESQCSPQALFLLSARNDRIKWETFQSHCCFSGSLSSRSLSNFDEICDVGFLGFSEDFRITVIRYKSILMATLARIEELKHCPFAEICWYFTDTWEQFRINGRIDIINGSNPDSLKLQQREKSWFAGSLKSRVQYLGPNPGLPSLSEETHQDLLLDPSTGPVDAFYLLVLDPDQIDYLNLKSNQRLTFNSRLSASGEKSWTSERINP
ncbi:pyridoxine/pyridoxamine 5'-phosphate oxidase 2 [Quillaja saponaria]|uniref:pyridoxal 5'-phosphate synthase n=1 Tax=Quillaja saponaria TaxID=32244 RepID=A0AAD7LR53_QUISA|nr:pyridoxine/pyridoxamine 5'-phosphate oxidase 2 [Quillaja saponaria]